MKLADEIKNKLITWCITGSDIAVPNYYVGIWEMDVMKVTSSDFVIEYEIKISKSDFKADFAKERMRYQKDPLKKHDLIKSGKRSNRFFFVVPEGLVTLDEVPDYAGLIYYNNGGWFRLVKNAKLLHKNKFDSYRQLARKLSFREMYVRRDLRKERAKKK